MTENRVDDKVKKFADAVGEFIKYWGFKKVHGRIWTHIYLSEKPITAKDLTRKLGVTKGLVSTALSELIAYQVVERVSLGDARSPGYQSNTDLVQVINNILRNRELRLTTSIRKALQELAEEMHSESPAAQEKIVKLQQMTDFAVNCLTNFLNSKTISTDRFETIMRLLS